MCSPGNPISIGTAFAIGLLIAFFVGRAIFGSAGNFSPDELRVAVAQIFITAYCAAAIRSQAAHQLSFV